MSKSRLSERTLEQIARAFVGHLINDEDARKDYEKALEAKSKQQMADVINKYVKPTEGQEPVGPGDIETLTTDIQKILKALGSFVTATWGNEYYHGGGGSIIKALHTK